MTQDQKDLVAEWSDHYITSAFLGSALPFIKEQHWLQQQQQQNGAKESLDFQKFIEPFFEAELQPLIAAKEFFLSQSLETIDALHKSVVKQEKQVADQVKRQSPEFQRHFLEQTLEKMDLLFQHEANVNAERFKQALHPGLSLYRTFDRIDEIFGLDYESDQAVRDPLKNRERIYAGAGVGVQSGYSTILTTIHHLKLKEGDRVVDLGSGYGRVGFVFGLIHKDIDFKGYEFVPHRVESAQRICERLGLNPNVDFITCDLSDSEFKIPEADVYYLYDPFSVETYALVLKRLIEISRTRNLTIVTKGNARAPLLEVATRENWPPHQEFDGGNLCFFKNF